MDSARTVRNIVNSPSASAALSPLSLATGVESVPVSPESPAGLSVCSEEQAGRRIKNESRAVGRIMATSLNGLVCANKDKPTLPLTKLSRQPALSRFQRLRAPDPEGIQRSAVLSARIPASPHPDRLAFASGRWPNRAFHGWCACLANLRWWWPFSGRKRCAFHRCHWDGA